PGRILPGQQADPRRMADRHRVSVSEAHPAGGEGVDGGCAVARAPVALDHFPTDIVGEQHENVRTVRFRRHDRRESESDEPEKPFLHALTYQRNPPDVNLSRQLTNREMAALRAGCAVARQGVLRFHEALAPVTDAPKPRPLPIRARRTA